MLLDLLVGLCVVGAAALAWAVRGRSSPFFGSNYWRGPKTRRAIALTFDDGPSESTSDLLTLLDDLGVRATFFMCGHHVRRLPRIVDRVTASGHEIGNHTDTHPYLFFCSPDSIYQQMDRAQQAIQEATGVRPALFRTPYLARWFGLASALKRLGLTNIAWTAIACDWKLPASGIVSRMAGKARPGAILCFHDGRELQHHPDISATLAAVAELVPLWRRQGYEFITVSEMIASKSR
jgi:peptidoglycan/xylan/chitin deacetylase (PgdA/CDA1 family)